MKKTVKIFLLISVLAMSLVFRLYGLNWDQNQHLHPDERFLTMVTMDLKWPKDFASFLDPESSTLNPYNLGHSFFVYGKVPLYINKFFSQFSHFSTYEYDNITLTGRLISALVDTGSVFLIFVLSLTVLKNFLVSLIASFLYGISVIPIQLSHFYTVDTFSVFFLLCSFYFLLRMISNSTFFILLSSFFFTLSFLSKINVLLFLPLVFLSLSAKSLKNQFKKELSKTKIAGILLNWLALVLIFIATGYLFLRLIDPSFFADSNLLNPIVNPKFIQNLKELKSLNNSQTTFPPAIQWINTRPVIYPLINTIYWGLGLPLGLLSLFSIVFLAFKISIKLIQTSQKLSTKMVENWFLLILIFTVSLFFLYQSTQFVKATRYFFPIYPFLSIINAYFLIKFISSKLKIGIVSLVLSASFIYPLSYLKIYGQAHPRIQASQWIYANITPGQSLSCEAWDDCLPLNFGNYLSGNYKINEINLYGEESEQKWQKIKEAISQTSYIILSSNRVYGSTMALLQKYPKTFDYYQSLFSEKLGFKKVAQFTNRPNIPIPLLKVCINLPWQNYGKIALKDEDCPLPGLSFVDDYADENLTVFDHPKVIIFERK